MKKEICLTVLFFVCILDVGNGYYYHYYITDRMKRKIRIIIGELVFDATRNVERIDHIKDYYTITPVFEIGQMLYYIRSKFARLVRVYVLASDNHNKYDYYDEHLGGVTESQHLAMDIYNLVEMLEEHVKKDPEKSLYNRGKNSKPFDLKKLTDMLKLELPREHLRQRPNHRYTRHRDVMNSHKMDGKGAKNADGLFDSDIE